MSDIHKELWPAFELELLEQLQVLDEQLALAANGQPADVHTLFRMFHTIKSSGAMMELAGMESLSHVAEDILDVHRKASTTPDSDSVRLLQQTADCLREIVASVTRDGRESAVDPKLLGDLRLQSQRLSGQPESAPRSSAPAAKAPAAMPVQETPLHASSWVISNADAGQFRAHLQAAIAANWPEQSPSRSSAWQALASLADALSMPVVADAVHRMESASHAESTELLAALLVRLRAIEAGTSRTLIPPEARPIFIEEARVCLASARQALRNLPADTASRIEGADSMTRAFSAQLVAAELLGWTSLRNALRLARQVLRAIARGVIKPNDALVSLIGLAGDLTEDMDTDLQDRGSVSALAERVTSGLQENVGLSALQAVTGQIVADISSRIDIAPGTLDFVSPSDLDALLQAIALRNPIAEVDADLEALPDAGASFLEWLREAGTTISNRTVLTGSGSEQTSRFRYLVSLTSTHEAAAREFAMLAGGTEALSLRPVRYRDEAVAQMPSGNAAEHVVPATDSRSQERSSHVRVDTRILNRISYRIGEIALNLNALEHRLSMMQKESAVARVHREELATTQDLVESLQFSVNRLNAETLSLRVIPIGGVLSRMARVVRTTARTLGKDVSLVLRGEDTRIDVAVSEGLAEPLTHLLRNAIDHGIEDRDLRLARSKPVTGTLTMAATEVPGGLVLKVSDDGGGLDRDKILARAIAQGLAEPAQPLTDREIFQFIFMPGFSTASAVTDVSGRGVGMDAARSRILQLGGRIEVTSEAGKGTTFLMHLPLTNTMQQSLLVEAAGVVYALPEANVVHARSMTDEGCHLVRGKVVLRLGNETIPRRGLAWLLSRDDMDETVATLDMPTVVIDVDGDRLALAVDAIIDRKDLHIRNLKEALARIPGVSGGAVLGDGRIAVVLECSGLLELAELRG